MSKRIKFLISYWSFWMAYFFIARGIFELYHIRQFYKIPFTIIFQSFAYGLWLDASITSYISIFPFIIVSLAPRLWPWQIKLISIYSIVLIVATSILIMLDLELFSAWGFRLDTSVLHYVSSPREAWISTLSSPILLLLTLGLVQLFFGFFIFRKYILTQLNFEDISIYSVPLFLLVTCSLIIPLRGGLQLSPINESAVFFSEKSIANQAAINCIWSFGHSITEQSYSEVNPYTYFNNDKAKQLFDSCAQLRKSPSTPILNTLKPNIIFVIWESGTAKAQTNYDGQEIVPQLKSLKNKGIYFSNCYASGMRTDKGLVAILSGYPSQPKPGTSIVRTPTKSSKLPSLTKELKNTGYTTKFIYGGEPEFANIKSYLLNSGFETVIGKNDFEKSQWNSKWGADDQYTFDRLILECNESKKPFFNALLTLTSHEPFDIPSKPLLKTDTRERLFLNSLHYTDSCLGDFIMKAERTAWWQNTLIVVVADHGHQMPGVGIAEHSADDYRIPLLLLGGALNTSNVQIEHTVSQTDIPNIILQQLQISDAEFIFGNNVINKPKYPSAYYSFNDGFGFVTDGVQYAHDNVSNRPLWDKDKANAPHIFMGKAYLQHSYQDYLLK